jgi:diketogulonate reductase-like aldo/keto reductase
LLTIAAKYKKSAAQVILRWLLQNGEMAGQQETGCLEK